MFKLTVRVVKWCFTEKMNKISMQMPVEALIITLIVFYVVYFTPTPPLHHFSMLYLG